LIVVYWVADSFPLAIGLKTETITLYIGFEI